MNREAVALGVPVYTTFAGRMGAVDERLIAERRLVPLTHAEGLDLRKRDQKAASRTRRDPRQLLDLLVGALPERRR
jgi:uncharacterized protein